ncbi:MAG: acetoacetate--CoA ligase [Betaproteobacteria bacterium]|jgi:acetoacetyl-CoA synthetase|nr:acetoacetate--CoA ligase [Rubrivivax sp.]
MDLPVPRITLYQQWLERERGLRFADYDAMWAWSVTDLDAFWQSIWVYFAVQSPTPHTAVLADDRMPGARWFPGAQLNFAQQVFRHAEAAHAAGHPAIVSTDEAGLVRGECVELSWPELQQQTARFAAALRTLGVRRGDRVCAVLPNTPQTAAVFLAVASLGAVWSVCSPDMGPVAVLDRFRQIEPTVLVACDEVRWAGVLHDKRALVDELLAGLPSVRHAVRGVDVRAVLHGEVPSDAALAGALAHAPGPVPASGAQPTLQPSLQPTLQPEWLPFDHPLWIVYSSGTTGLPKPIVHGHGGVVLEALKSSLLNNLGPTVETGDRFHWFSTTGWIMWNCQMAGLLGGTTICLFDGSPGGPSAAPDWTTLWRFAALSRATFFGAGAAFYASCLKADVQPAITADLTALRAVGSTGSPLSDECHDWIWERLPRVGGQPIWIDCISGGTDFAGAFVGGNITLPQVRGQMQCRWLGAAVQAWDEQGASVIDQVGELVCARPIPSMPLRFWNDEGDRRYRDSYFDMYPGVWRHGDWIRITPRTASDMVEAPAQAAAGAAGLSPATSTSGPEALRIIPSPFGPTPVAHGAIIYGRSDATINRQGVRMGTAELYRVVEALPEVLDSLVVDLEYLGRESFMPLFIVLRDGLVLDAALNARIHSAIRQGLGPRYVPSQTLQVQAIPRTLSGKKMELPVKKLLLGADPAKVMNRDAMANAAAVDWFIDYARRRGAG